VTDTALPVDTWIERNVELPNGSRHVMVVDTASDDPLTRLYMTGSGIWLNAYLVRVMLAIVKPGDRVVDLGAFAGDFALAAAANGCEVLAVEANTALAEMVRYSAELSNFEGLRVVNAAIGDVPGSVEFMANGPWGQVHTDPTGAGDARFAHVAQVTVDDLLEALAWDAVAFMKVDIEGSEMRALAGASRLLSAPGAPALLIESNISPLMENGTEPRVLLEAIEAFGYSLYRVMPEEIVRCDASDFQAETVADYLALKNRTPADLGLVVREPLTLSETAARVLSEARNENEAHRRSIGWQLQFAAPELFEHPDVQRAIRELRDDPRDDVRAAVLAPVVATDAALESSAVDGRWLAERVLRESAEARAAVVHRLNGRVHDEASWTAEPEAWPGPLAMQVARQLSGAATRHPWLAKFARRLIQIAGRTPG
jgi:FkbM family methyltransferase